MRPRILPVATTLVTVALCASALFAAGIAPAAAAEADVVRPIGADLVAGKYIVTLKDDVVTTAADVATRYDAKPESVYHAALRGFSFTGTERQARRLAADPSVARVEADSKVRAQDITRENPQWHLDRIDQRTTALDNRYTYPDHAGQGVTVYVLDTGVRTSHSEFEGRASAGFDAINDGWNGQDCSTSGHGTHVAGTVAGKTFGVANKARIVSVRVLNCDGSGSVSQIVAGVDWVTANAVKPAVVNMSLGGGESDTEDAAINKSIGTGLSYVVAAGNSESNACFRSPARIPNVITVGASSPSDERGHGWARFGDTGSNHGTCLDLFAPGENVKSSHNATDSSTQVLTGTSMASPHVAGAAALLLGATPTLAPKDVTTAILDRSSKNVLQIDPTKDRSPNRLLYTGPLTQPQCAVSDDRRTAIPDQGTATATLQVTSCGRKVATNANVRVKVEHPFRGDVSLALVTPSGAEIVLKTADADDGAANIDQTFPLSLSTVDANGTWKLVARDNFGLDEGALTGWTLTL